MRGRALVVLADGAQAAFCAGVVAELARGQVIWQEAAGAGLGVLVALYAVAGQPEQAAELLDRQQETEASVFASPLALAQEHLGWSELLVLPDPWRWSGWLARERLEELLAPALALVDRFPLFVALEDVSAGWRRWCPLHSSQELVAGCAFPMGWAPTGEGLWGGVGACGELEPPPFSAEVTDLVCGFPVPAVERPGLGTGLLATVQRREELLAAQVVARWQKALPTMGIWAPQASTYLKFSQRENALLGVEYPLPTERNGALCALMVEYGRFLVRESRKKGAEV